jgi:hypothetical protein
MTNAVGVPVMSMSAFETPQYLTAEVHENTHELNLYSDRLQKPTQLVLSVNGANVMAGWAGDSSDLPCAQIFIAGWCMRNSLRPAFSHEHIPPFLALHKRIPHAPSVAFVFEADRHSRCVVDVSRHNALEHALHTFLRSHDIEFTATSNKTWSYTVLK